MPRLCWPLWRRDLAVALVASVLTSSILVPIGMSAVRDVRAQAGRDLISQAVSAAADQAEGIEGQREAEILQVASNAVAPEVPKGAHVFIDKNPPSYAAGDIVAYSAGDKTYLARVVRVDQEAGRITVSRNGEDNKEIAVGDLLGRVLLNTR